MVEEKYPSNKYQNDKICQNRWPQVVWEPSPENQLSFSVSDLCREVLTNSQLSVWCTIAKSIGWDNSCNDIKREKITFYFNYSATTNGYQIDCKVTGLFGSGVYVPRTSGYMSMDPDFLDFEADYAKKFQYELQQRLKN